MESGGVTSKVSVAAIEIGNVASYPVLKRFQKFIHDLTHSIPIN
jgi:predicted enzyme involved in methoxymalonyl-ACP biosynthesis